MTDTPTLYCPRCERHTGHRHLVAQYSTQCQRCHTQTGQFQRLQDEQLHFEASDGTAGQVVYNDPETVTFYVAQGAHRGYYHFEKRTGKKRIERIA